MEIHNCKNKDLQNLMKNDENRVLARKLHQIKRRMLRQIGASPIERISQAPPNSQSEWQNQDIFKCDRMIIEEKYHD